MLYQLFKTNKKTVKEEKEQAEHLMRRSRLDVSRIMVISFVKVLDRLLQARQADIEAKRCSLPADNGCDTLV
jgi:hypothetical protein